MVRGFGQLYGYHCGYLNKVLVLALSFLGPLPFATTVFDVFEVVSVILRN